jgi:hypothetical protein
VKIPLFSRKTFTLSSTSKIIEVREVSVDQYTEGVLLVRCHAAPPATGSVAVVAYSISNTPDEPQTDFIDPDTAVATCTIDSSVEAGDLVRATLSSGFGGGLQIRVEASSPSTSPILSGELVMKV